MWGVKSPLWPLEKSPPVLSNCYWDKHTISLVSWRAKAAKARVWYFTLLIFHRFHKK